MPNTRLNFFNDRLISSHRNYLVNSFIRAVSSLIVEGSPSRGVIVVVARTRREFDHLLASLDISSEVSVIISRDLLRGVRRFISISSRHLISQSHI